MPAKTIGDKGNLGVLFLERRQFPIAPMVVKELWADVAPFLTIVANRNTKTGLKDPTYKMFEHRNPWIEQKFQTKTDTVAVAVNGTPSANITVDTATIKGLSETVDASYIGYTIEVWDATLSTKKGTALIYSQPATDKITLVNLSSSAVINIVPTDWCYVIGTAIGEGQTSPEAWSDELKVVYGNTQIFRTPVEVTGTLYQAALRGESSELARLRLMKQQEHKIQKERAFLFQGSPAGTGMDGTTYTDLVRTDKDGKAVRTTMGIIPMIQKYASANVFDMSVATYKYGNFVDHMEAVFQYIPETGFKYGLCGRGFLSYFSKLDNAAASFNKNSGWNVQIGKTERDTLGFNVRTLETPHGVLKLVPTPSLRGPYNGYCIIPSDENLFHAQYRASKYSTNIKTENGYDGVKDEYFSDEGLGMTLAESHFMMRLVA
jgi:hypothetical protein